ncbi:MAG: hypothetical protein V9819_00680 [Candidatus Dasytiphilus stammeri]
MVTGSHQFYFLRNLGVVLSYALIAWQDPLQVINKFKLNSTKIFSELNQNWSILSEPLQTVMRRYIIKNAYEILKNFTRGRHVDMKVIHAFIENNLFTRRS